MRRLGLLAVLVVLVSALFAPGVAHAAPSAHVTGIDTVQNVVNLNVVGAHGTIGGCVPAKGFRGRVNVRNAATGEKLFIGVFKGTCGGAQQAWETFVGKSLATVPCGAPVRVGGQVRLANGTKFHIKPAILEEETECV